jgi:hypothetical protein
MDLMYLIELVVAWKQRAQSEHLEEDASNTPVVHFVIVVAVGKKAFWRPIPPRRDVLSERGL